MGRSGRLGDEMKKLWYMNRNSRNITEESPIFNFFFYLLIPLYLPIPMSSGLSHIPCKMLCPRLKDVFFGLMVEPGNNQVETFFHNYAQSFDGIYGSMERRGFLQKTIDRFFRQSMFDRFERTLDAVKSQEIKSVLDIGCGPGRYCVEFLKLGKKVHGIDLAEGMLAIASQMCKTQFPDGNFEFEKGDYMEKSFSEKYDAAVLMGLFDYVQYPVAMISKLKKDVRHLILASFPKSGGILAFQRKIRYRLRHCPLYLYSRKDLDEIFLRADIVAYEISDSSREFFVKITL